MRRSTAALVAVLAVVLQGAHAARPIDISNQRTDSIQPMSATEEKVVSDPSRELLSMHYPPPPPVGELQGERGWPSITNSLDLDFNSADNATQFVSDIGDAVRFSKEQVENTIEGRKLQRDITSPGYAFASTYLAVALATSQAEDGKTEVTADGGSVNMATTLYYSEGTEEATMQADATAFRTNVDNNRDNVLSQSQWDALKDSYGVTTDRSSFLDAVTNEDNYSIDGAAALKSSLLMGVAAVLSAFLMA